LLFILYYRNKLSNRRLLFNSCLVPFNLLIAYLAKLPVTQDNTDKKSSLSARHEGKWGSGGTVPLIHNQELDGCER